MYSEFKKMKSNSNSEIPQAESAKNTKTVSRLKQSDFFNWKIRDLGGKKKRKK